MPTYQYACTECGDRSEVVQRFTDDPLTVCSACGGKLRKIFSPVGIVFKGSGFYRTDSRNGSSTVPASKDTAASGSNGSSETSSAGSDAAKNGSSGGDSGSSTSSSSTSGDKKSSSVSSAAAS
ncbi:MAG TPA: FmdB family zinc ribbon protein [Streptosporangiaceae bacterium]|nr:FmdB family zinc ribbon protein [Streptosporangiaceae bacterium]